MKKMNIKILWIIALMMMVLTISFFAMSVCNAEYIGNESTSLYELPQEQEEETSEIVEVVEDVVENPKEYSEDVKDLIIKYLPLVFAIAGMVATYFKTTGASKSIVDKMKQRLSEIDVSKTMKDQIDMCQRMLDENTELRKQLRELIEEIRRVKG